MKKIKVKVVKTGKTVKNLSKEYACCKKTQRRNTGVLA